MKSENMFLFGIVGSLAGQCVFDSYRVGRVRRAFESAFVVVEEQSDVAKCHEEHLPVATTN